MRLSSFNIFTKITYQLAVCTFPHTKVSHIHYLIPRKLFIHIQIVSNSKEIIRLNLAIIYSSISMQLRVSTSII